MRKNRTQGSARGTLGNRRSYLNSPRNEAQDMINWDEITPTQFEELCYELIEFNGFKNIEWFGKGGGDKGRDLTAVKFEEPLSGVQKERKWVIQCKRYTSTKLSKLEIENFFVAAREHSPDSVLLIVSRTLSSNLKDWLNAVRENYSFEIFVWEEKDIQREIAIHRTKLRTKISVSPTPGEPTVFYEQRTVGVVYMCNAPELEELGFYLLNDYGPDGNAKAFQEFVDYIRHNEIEIYVEDGDEESD